jgi:hypothetical protein
MPSKNIVVSLFVSSPSDVKEEREIVDKVITELNRTWSRINNVHIDAIRWERDARPGFGIDAQSVLNSHLQSTIFFLVFFGGELERQPDGVFREQSRNSSWHSIVLKRTLIRFILCFILKMRPSPHR